MPRGIELLVVPTQFRQAGVERKELTTQLRSSTSEVRVVECLVHRVEADQHCVNWANLRELRLEFGDLLLEEDLQAGSCVRVIDSSGGDFA